jgi:hypothetical protein
MSDMKILRAANWMIEIAPTKRPCIKVEFDSVEDTHRGYRAIVDAVAAMVKQDRQSPAEWLPIESKPTSESVSFLVRIPDADNGDALAVQVSNFQGDMYPDCKAGIIDWEDRIIGATHWANLPLTNTGEQA